MRYEVFLGLLSLSSFGYVIYSRFCGEHYIHKTVSREGLISYL